VGRRNLLEKLTVTELVKKFSTFIHSFPHYFPKIHSHIILLTMPRSSTWSLPFKFSDKNFACISHHSHAYYMPINPILLELKMTLLINYTSSLVIEFRVNEPINVMFVIITQYSEKLIF
jgi:hypothetical protein